VQFINYKLTQKEEPAQKSRKISSWGTSYGNEMAGTKPKSPEESLTLPRNSDHRSGAVLRLKYVRLAASTLSSSIPSTAVVPHLVSVPVSVSVHRTSHHHILISVSVHLITHHRHFHSGVRTRRTRRTTAVTSTVTAAAVTTATTSIAVTAVSATATVTAGGSTTANVVVAVTAVVTTAAAATIVTAGTAARRASSVITAAAVARTRIRTISVGRSIHRARSAHSGPCAAGRAHGSCSGCCG